MLAAEIMRAGFVGKGGRTGAANVQDEQVREPDVISDDVIRQVIDHAPSPS
jgi:fructose-1,6-bisphosphatase